MCNTADMETTSNLIPIINCRRCKGVHGTTTPATHREFYDHHDGQRHQDLCRACSKQVVTEHAYLDGVEIVAFSTLARQVAVENYRLGHAFCRMETAHDDYIVGMNWSEEQATRYLVGIWEKAQDRMVDATDRAEGLAEIDTSGHSQINPYTGKSVKYWA